MSINEDDLNEFWDSFDKDSESKFRLLIEWSQDHLDFEGLPSIEWSSIEPKYKKKLTASVFIKKKGNELF